MKVLSWMARRLIPAQSCTTFLPESYKEGVDLNSKLGETQALLEHGDRMVIDVVDDWNGILAIGTLAISPLLSGNYSQIIEEANDDIDNQNHEDNNQILRYHNVAYDNEDYEADPLMEVELFSHELGKEIYANKEIVEVEQDDDEDGERETKKRVTLADLLLADSDHHLVKQLADKLHAVADADKHVFTKNPKPSFKVINLPTPTKNGLSKAKKFVKEDLRPLKKLNQIMKKIMKKKIHPEIEGKMEIDKEMESKNVVGGPTEEKCAANECASLLRNQDAMV